MKKPNSIIAPALAATLHLSGCASTTNQENAQTPQTETIQAITTEHDFANITRAELQIEELTTTIQKLRDATASIIRAVQISQPSKFDHAMKKCTKVKESCVNGTNDIPDKCKKIASVEQECETIVLRNEVLCDIEFSNCFQEEAGL